MKRVQGIGGIFFRAKDPKKMQDWYDKHLGVGPLEHSPWGSEDDASLLEYRDIDDPDRKCYAVFAPFADDTDYFDAEDGSSTGSQFMLNLRVDNMDEVLAQLRKEGVHIHDEIRVYDYGRFARITDPDGRVIELWEPAKGY